MRAISSSGKGQSRICDEAGINEHDLKNFLGPKKHRPRHLSGLRMLHYAANWHPERGVLPSALNEKIKQLVAVTERYSEFEPEEDYFFKHLQRLNVIAESDCKRICGEISGHYYSHRLSRRPNHIIRSHYEMLPFNPYNRLPHFINKLKYDGKGTDDTVERTSRGQIFQVADTYILLGFVYYGYEWTRKTKYDGVQVNIFPREQFTVKRNRVIDGIFLSYVYHDRYEIGPMKLVRGPIGFKDDEVGEFSTEAIQQKVPSLNMPDLQLDLSALTKLAPNLDGKITTTLLSCLSFVFGSSGVKHNLP